MNLKIFAYLFCFIFCFLGLGLGYAANNQQSELIDSIIGESVADMSLDQKVSLILLPCNLAAGPIATTNKQGEERDQDNIFWDSHQVLNGVSGFYTHGLSVPFPDAETIKQIKEKSVFELLYKDLLYHASTNGYIGVLAPNKYFFERERGLNSFEPEPKYEHALWLFKDDGLHAEPIPVYNMPEVLQKYRVGFSAQGGALSKNALVPVWRNPVDSGRADSFEVLIAKGVIFLTDNYERDHARLVRAFKNRILVKENLDEGCRKILRVLQKKVKFPFPAEPLSPVFSEYLRSISFEQSIRVFQRENKPILPTNLSETHVKTVSDIDNDKTAAFERMVKNHISLNDTNKTKIDYLFWLHDGLTLTDSVIDQRIAELKDNYQSAKIILVIGSNGNFFRRNTIPSSIETVVVGASNSSLVWEYLGQAVFSGIRVSKAGKHENWSAGLKGLSVEKEQTRLKFGVPEEAGMLRDSLVKIDELMAEAIKMKAIPGAQVLIARDGVVVWNRTYGHHTYNKNRPVGVDDMYDVASVTKVAATIPSLMKLFESDQWALNDSLAQFFPQTNATDKAGITLKELLLHESGLPSFIPFYLNAIDKKSFSGRLLSRRYSRQYNIKLDDYAYLNRSIKYRDDVFSSKLDSTFSIPVASKLFLNATYLDSIMMQVINAPMRTRHRYLYSDLGFYFLGELVSRLSGMEMNYYADQHFYQPLGARNTSFLPFYSYDQDKIIPTENDKAFRKQLLHGWVHDPGAAMMGGVAGHAGLFSNALGLAKLMQMYLNGGTYGGERFLEKETIALFTRQHNEDNRRGLGFDKPEPDTLKNSPVSDCVSLSSFGHSGFTGTMVWADPTEKIVYIFLSNRIHPNQYNKKLIRENFRTRIQDIIYRSIISEPNNSLSPSTILPHNFAESPFLLPYVIPL